MMTSWLGLALAGICGLVAVRRGLHREAPASVMAAGMAVMSFAMAGLGPTLVHGPWWAAGFAAVAVWPLLRSWGRRVRSAEVGHLLCGLAMTYMCALPAMPAMDGAAIAASADHLSAAPPDHAMAGMGPIDLPGGPTAVPGPVGGAMALLGWALACYFLLSTITTLTRRATDAAPTRPRLAMLDEAVVGLVTAVMLVAFS
jgi:Domain of unknown function (DUF5134)